AHGTLKPGLRTLILTFAIALNLTAQETNFVAEAEAAYKTAQSIYATNNSSPDAAINLARTAFDYADLAPNDTIRETVANNGIAVAKSIIATNTNSVPAHYY